MLDGNIREPLQCQGCGENHMLKDCLRRRDNPRTLYNLGSAVIVEDMVRETPRIYATLQDQKANHNSTMIKIEGKIAT